MLTQVLEPKSGFIRDVDIVYSSVFVKNIEYALGAAHYSYSFARGKFVELIFGMGFFPRIIERPESIPSVSPAKGDRRVIHLIWRSTEDIRILKGAYNILCFAWEFDVLRDFGLPTEHPFVNQKRMLSLVDEIWAPSSYTVEILKKHELKNVYLVPAPVKDITVTMPKMESLSSLGHVGVAPLYLNSLLSENDNRIALARKKRSLINAILSLGSGTSMPKIFLAVLNPEDERKKIDVLIRSFDFLSRERSDCCLLIKLLTSPRRHDIEEVIARFVGEKLEGISAFNNNNILMMNDYLSEEKMGCLYALADFYVSMSIAEGQNLPLIEAMAAGCIPVSANVTAMRDYINSDNSVIIETEEVLDHRGKLAANIALRPFTHKEIRLRPAVEALRKAAQLDQAALELKRLQGIKTISSIYSFRAVAEKIESRFISIARGWNDV